MIKLKKNKKGNVKGFVLVETLITTVFVATILSIIYINFYPLIGEYEKREAYDDVDSKYSAFWLKKVIQDANISNSCMPTQSNPIIEIGDSCLSSDHQIVYQKLKKATGANMVYLTYYSLVDNQKRWDVKDTVKNSSNYSSEFKEYVAYLPNYSAFKGYNQAEYRILVEFKHEIKDGVDKKSDYKTFSTMEVSK